MKKIILASIIVSVGFLAGCTRQPTQEDLTQAIQTTINESNTQAKTMGGGLLGGTMNIELIKLEKLGDCVKRTDGKTFDCDIKATTKNSLTGTTSATSKIAFVQSNDGNWVAINEASPAK